MVFSFSRTNKIVRLPSNRTSSNFRVLSSSGGSPPPTLWTPLNSTSVAGWFDASVFSSLVIANGTVSQWNDVRNNGLAATQGTTASQPTYVSNFTNSRAGLRFDGIDDNITLSTNSILNNAAYIALFVVYQKVTNTLADTLFFYSTVSNNQTAMISVRTNGTDLIAGGRRVSANTFQSVTAVASANTNVTLVGTELDYSNTGLFLWNNGSLLASSNSFQTVGVSESGTPLLPGRIGNNGNNSEALDGNLGELILFASSSRMTTAERERVEGYLSHKWGINSNLPVAHPFFTTPPYV